MGNKSKDIDIKDSTYYFMIDEKPHKYFRIYYIGYVTIKYSNT